MDKKIVKGIKKLFRDNTCYCPHGFINKILKLINKERADAYNTGYQKGLKRGWYKI